MRVPPAIRDAVVTRDGSRCARCGISVGNVPASVHHRKPRGMGGTRDVRSYDLRNLVLVCGSGTTLCHGEIEGNREIAYATGWLLRSYDDLDRPLVTKDGRRVYLYADDQPPTEVIDAASILAAGVLQ